MRNPTIPPQPNHIRRPLKQRVQLLQRQPLRLGQEEQRDERAQRAQSRVVEIRLVPDAHEEQRGRLGDAEVAEEGEARGEGGAPGAEVRRQDLHGHPPAAGAPGHDVSAFWGGP